MNNTHKETIRIRFVSCAFMVLAIAIFKPFGLGVWQWQAYVHLLAIFALGMFSCFLTEVILRFVVRMPRSYDRGVGYIISRNLRFQCINTPLVSLLICLYRHFAMSDVVEGNKLSLSNYLETLVIIAFLSFAIGLYWRFKFRSRYLAAELEETRLLNEQLKKLQNSGQDSQITEEGSTNQVSQIILEGTTNEHVSLEISDLLYIEAVGNYVKVVNKHDGEVKTNMLRATMKQMEDALQAYPMIVRCHRAFMVNLGQVEQISSNSRAMQLVMHHTHDAIPVSRSNVHKLKELLG
ncbi:MAG: LytTR family transcriptional regulator DNA-binding domain-containing protein [Prevotella sp.]|nr:LytTR family transcriptional regulator DNA-binding domain-containing protein [Prevotella sp.]